MEESKRVTSAGEVFTAVKSSAAQQQPQLKQELGYGKEAAVKATAEAPTRRLRKPDPFYDNDNQQGARKNRSCQRRPLRCQVDGCGIDLTQARKYFQRYRVCERHLKSPSLQMDGCSVRFCDQCSKFHDIAMFEANRRTCNEKLERTRQARSDKRRQQTEQAERAAMRASSGWRTRLQGAADLKRQHGTDCDRNDIPDEENNALAGNAHVLLKRSRLQQQPQQQAAALPQMGSSPLAVPPTSTLLAPPQVADQQQDKSKSILARHRAAFAAAMACGSRSGVNGAGTGTLGGVQVLLPIHSHGYANGGLGAGNRDGSGGGSGCSASSLSSWDDGHPHMQLLRLNSVSSHGSAGGSHGSYIGPNAAAGCGGGSSTNAVHGHHDTLGFLHQPVDRGVGQARHAAGPSTGMPMTVQTAAVLLELSAMLEGSTAAGLRTSSAGRGPAPARGFDPVPRDIHSRVGTVEALHAGRGSGGGAAAATPNRQLGCEREEMPYTEAVSPQGRIGSGVKLYGSSGGDGGARAHGQSAAAAIAQQRLLVQLQMAATEDFGKGSRSQARYGEDCGPCGIISGRVASVGPQQTPGEDDLYGGLSGRANDDTGEATTAVLRLLLASLADRRGAVRSQNDTVTSGGTAWRTADTDLRNEPLGPKFLPSEVVDDGFCAGGPAFHTSAAGPHFLTTGFRGPAPTHAAAGKRSMPVLDLTVAPQMPMAAPDVASTVVKLGGSGGAAVGCSSTWLAQRHLQRQRQLLLQLIQVSDEYDSTALSEPHWRQQQQQHMYPQEEVSDAAEKQYVRQQLRQLLEMLGSRSAAAADGAGASGATSMAAGAAMPPLSPPRHRQQHGGPDAIQREWQKRAAEVIACQQQRSVYGPYGEVAAATPQLLPLSRENVDGHAAAARVSSGFATNLGDL